MLQHITNLLTVSAISFVLLVVPQLIEQAV